MNEVKELVEGINRRFDKDLMKLDLFDSVVWKELDDGATALDIDRTAENLYSIGYRKQSEGEWIDKPTGAYGRMQSWCSACGKHSGIGGIESNRHKPFCPNCGAKMKEGE